MPAVVQTAAPAASPSAAGRGYPFFCLRRARPVELDRVGVAREAVELGSPMRPPPPSPSPPDARDAWARLCAQLYSFANTSPRRGRLRGTCAGGVGLGARRRQWRPGVSASPGEPPAGAVPAGACGLQLTRTGANMHKENDAKSGEGSPTRRRGALTSLGGGTASACRPPPARARVLACRGRRARRRGRATRPRGPAVRSRSAPGTST
jgi:hypothetical protein